MAFCYNGAADDKMRHKAKLTFFGENVASSDISVRIISDTELNEGDLAWHPLWEEESKKPYLRRCGIMFDSLSQSQEDSIDMYIQGLGIGMKLYDPEAFPLPELA